MAAQAIEELTWADQGEPTGAARAIYGVDADAGTVIAAGTGGDLFRSTNQGASWTQITVTGWNTSYLIAEVLALGSDVWFICGDNGQIAKSTDDGLTWAMVTSHSFGTQRLHAITYDSALGRLMFSGAEAIGYTDDAGTSFTHPSLPSSMTAENWAPFSEAPTQWLDATGGTGPGDNVTLTENADGTAFRMQMTGGAASTFLENACPDAAGQSGNFTFEFEIKAIGADCTFRVLIYDYNAGYTQLAASDCTATTAGYASFTLTYTLTGAETQPILYFNDITDDVDVYVRNLRFQPGTGGGTYIKTTDDPASVPDLYALATDGNGTWIAGGEAGRLMKSVDDGATWSYVGQTADAYRLFDAAYGNNTWLMVGRSGRVVTTTDLSTFAIAAPFVDDTASVLSAAYHNTLFVIGNTGNEILSALDATGAWTTTTSAWVSGYQIRRIAHDDTDDLLYAGGHTSHTDGKVQSAELTLEEFLIASFAGAGAFDATTLTFYTQVELVASFDGAGAFDAVLEQATAVNLQAAFSGAGDMTVQLSVPLIFPSGDEAVGSIGARSGTKGGGIAPSNDGAAGSISPSE